MEVAWATPERQLIIALRMPPGSTAGEAVTASGIRRQCPAIPPDAPLGIFSRKVAASQVLRDGDRVEIYRPLQADPKEVRRRNAALQRSGKLPH